MKKMFLMMALVMCCVFSFGQNDSVKSEYINSYTSISGHSFNVFDSIIIGAPSKKILGDEFYENILVQGGWSLSSNSIGNKIVIEKIRVKRNDVVTFECNMNKQKIYVLNVEKALSSSEIIQDTTPNTQKSFENFQLVPAQKYEIYSLKKTQKNIVSSIAYYTAGAGFLFLASYSYQEDADGTWPVPMCVGAVLSITGLVKSVSAIINLGKPTYIVPVKQ